MGSCERGSRNRVALWQQQFLTILLCLRKVYVSSYWELHLRDELQSTCAINTRTIWWGVSIVRSKHHNIAPHFTNGKFIKVEILTTRQPNGTSCSFFLGLLIARHIDLAGQGKTTLQWCHNLISQVTVANRKSHKQSLKFYNPDVMRSHFLAVVGIDRFRVFHKIVKERVPCRDQKISIWRSDRGHQRIIRWSSSGLCTSD